MFFMEALLVKLHHWAMPQPDIVAVMLVGSHARNAARPDSDVDVIILTTQPQRYTEDTAWMGILGETIRYSHEDWGAVHGIRAFYADGLEVEYGITTPAWAATAPVDPGTRRVIADGARIIYDPSGLGAALIRAVCGL